MAGAGFKDFTVGEVLTSADVDNYLMQQSVMRFANAAARGSALGTAVVAEGMTTYLDDVDEFEVYDGSDWRGLPVLGTAVPSDGQLIAYGTATGSWEPVDPTGFDSRVVITATDASWSVPALANPIVKVWCIGAGGGGMDSGGTPNPGSGGTTSFGAYVSASGGAGANQTDESQKNGPPGFVSSNGGNARNGDGNGGQVEFDYVDLTGVSSVNVTIGAGGTGQGGAGDGGRGEVIVEYRAA